jgi:hypothetical protein
VGVTCRGLRIVRRLGRTGRAVVAGEDTAGTGGGGERSKAEPRAVYISEIGPPADADSGTRKGRWNEGTAGVDVPFPVPFALPLAPFTFALSCMDRVPCEIRDALLGALASVVAGIGGGWTSSKSFGHDTGAAWSSGRVGDVGAEKGTLAADDLDSLLFFVPRRNIFAFGLQSMQQLRGRRPE